MRSSPGWLVADCAAALVSAGIFVGPACATEVYAGGSVGEADARAQIVLSSQIPSAPDNGRQYEFDRHRTAWKVLVGARPISPLGIEVEYIDFGHPEVATRLAPPLALPLQADVSIRGTAVFAVGYLPLRLPAVDVYGKVGAAALHNTVNATDVGSNCRPGAGACSELAWSPSTQHIDHTVTDLAYGAGVRFRVPSSALAVRLEYERVSQHGGDPDLLSLGVTYSFF